MISLAFSPRHVVALDRKYLTIDLALSRIKLSSILLSCCIASRYGFACLLTFFQSDLISAAIVYNGLFCIVLSFLIEQFDCSPIVAGLQVFYLISFSSSNTCCSTAAAVSSRLAFSKLKTILILLISFSPLVSLSIVFPFVMVGEPWLPC